MPSIALPLDAGVLSSHDFASVGFIAGVSLGSATWPSANRAYLVPCSLRRPVLLTAFWVHNGATATGNLDIGLYTEDGVRLLSTGSTAQSGTTACQVADVTDTWVQPGLYWLALVMDGTSGTVLRESYTFRTIGLAIAASSFPLPATITPATVSNSFFPLFGALTRRSTL